MLLLLSQQAQEIFQEHPVPMIAVVSLVPWLLVALLVLSLC
jgi:hypothetical protein